MRLGVMRPSCLKATTSSLVSGLGFGGFGVKGLGFKVWGLGFRVSGLGFGVEGLGLRV